MEVNGVMSVIGIKTDDKDQKICPLLSLAGRGILPCQTLRSAFWVWHEVDGEDFDDYGHCGFVHPGHQGMDWHKA